MCQMVVTSERYVFYFGIFICGGPLNGDNRVSECFLFLHRFPYMCFLIIIGKLR